MNWLLSTAAAMVGSAEGGPYACAALYSASRVCWGECSGRFYPTDIPAPGLGSAWFIVVEALLLQWSGAQVLVRTMTGGYSWFIVLAAFMGVSWLAEKWAHSEASPQMQYAGLALFVVAEAIIFLPLLYIAAYFSSPNVIPTAGIVTALLFGG